MCICNNNYYYNWRGGFKSLRLFLHCKTVLHADLLCYEFVLFHPRIVQAASLKPGFERSACPCADHSSVTRLRRARRRWRAWPLSYFWYNCHRISERCSRVEQLYWPWKLKKGKGSWRAQSYIESRCHRAFRWGAGNSKNLVHWVMKSVEISWNLCPEIRNLFGNQSRNQKSNPTHAP